MPSFVDTEQESLVQAGKVKQGHVMMGHVGCEDRTGLGIEAYDFLGHQIGYRPGIVQPCLLDDMYFTRERTRRQFLDLLRKYTNFEHKNLVSE